MEREGVCPWCSIARARWVWWHYALIPLVEFDLWVVQITRFADVLFPRAEIVVDVQLLYQFVQNDDA